MMNSFHHQVGTLGGVPDAFRSQSKTLRKKRPSKKATLRAQSPSFSDSSSISASDNASHVVTYVQHQIQWLECYVGMDADAAADSKS